MDIYLIKIIKIKLKIKLKMIKYLDKLNIIKIKY
jgi:hypothetical protein